MKKQKDDRLQLKRNALKKIYTNGVIKLPIGSYAKIAKKTKFSSAYVRHVLNPSRREWNIVIIKEAISLMRKEAEQQIALQKEINDTVVLYHKTIEGGSHDE